MVGLCSASCRLEADFEAYIVVFGPASIGSVALVIYEWQDAKLLGIDSDGTGAGQNEVCQALLDSLSCLIHGNSGKTRESTSAL